MIEGKSVLEAREAFDNCPNRTTEQLDVYKIEVTCPRYPDGTTFIDTKTESQKAKFVYDSDPDRGRAARRIGCLGCKYRNATPDELEGKKQMDGFHPAIAESCGGLFASEHYTEAATKGFLLVRDRLRELTGHERATEAFGKGGLRIGASVAENVEDDFQRAVIFLAMSGDMFRNVGSHTADSTITGSEQARSMLSISSLLMHYLDSAEVNENQQ